MARKDSVSLEDIERASRMQIEMERVTAAGRRCINRAEKILKPRRRGSGRIREAVDEVSSTLVVESYLVTHIKRPTCAVVTAKFSTRRRAYVYISEMMAQGVIRDRDWVSITTDSYVKFE